MSAPRLFLPGSLRRFLLWIEPLARAGTRGLDTTTARYVLMSNYVMALVVITTLGFITLVAIYDRVALFPIIVSLVGLVVSSVLGLILNARGYPRIGRILVSVCLTATLLQNDWYLGNAAGARQLFFAAVPGMFLLVPQNHRVEIFVHCLMFGGAYLLSMLLFEAPRTDLSPNFLRFYSVVTTASSFVLVGLFFFLFYLETHRVELMREEAELEQLQRYRDLVDNVEEGIFRINAEGILQSANPSMATMLGYPNPESLMERVGDFRMDVMLDAQALMDLGTALEASGRISGFEHMFRRRNGQLFPGSLSTRVIRDASGRVEGYDGILTDISQRRERDRLRAAQQKAEAETRAKSEFLARMSHEIRTPMNAVIGFTDLALRPDASSRRFDYLTKIRMAADNLLHIINDILDFSRLEAGKLSVEALPFSLRRMLDRVRSMLAEQAEHKGLAFDLQCDDQVPDRLRGDAARIQQILVNLLGNAIKFSDKGRVWLTATAQTRGDVVTLQITVNDEGIGMSPEQLGRLFTPFTQADETTSRRYGGSGLGLSISRQLAHCMDGRLWADSQLGRGSCFTLELPLTRSSDEADPAVETVATPEPLSGLRVLLVEDNALNQELAVDLLTSMGANPTIAGDGVDALRILDREPFDLVLMDVQMPRLDGYAATRRIREQPRFAALPVIAMTANVMAEDQARCLAAGMDAVLPKPVVYADLHQMLLAWGPGGARRRQKHDASDTA